MLIHLLSVPARRTDFLDVSATIRELYKRTGGGTSFSVTILMKYLLGLQVGPCTGIDGGDQLWVARYILLRLAELYNVDVSISSEIQTHKISIGFQTKRLQCSALIESYDDSFIPRGNYYSKYSLEQICFEVGK